jgi:hypothetical protein
MNPTPESKLMTVDKKLTYLIAKVDKIVDEIGDVIKEE